MAETSDAVLLRATRDGVTLRVRVKPGARRDRVIGEYGGALKVEVSAAAEKGKANLAVRKLLARTFDVPQSAVHILSGEASQNKTTRIGNLSVEEVGRRLEAFGIDMTVA
jgi:uncharacterized protein (TIGR00251 family)